jgi:glycosyltransferase involved in cell wall biosynthesis
VNPGGAGVLIAAAMRSLAEARIHASALCEFPESEVTQANAMFADDGLDDWLEARGVHSISPDLPEAPTIYERNGLRFAAALETLARDERIDLVEFPDYGGLGAASLRARAGGAVPDSLRIIVRVHGTLGTIDDAEGVVVDHLRRRMHEEEAYALQNADLVMVPTLPVGLEYANRYGIAPGRLVVSPPPMDRLLKGFEPIDRLVDPHHFLFYGKLQEVKGCDLLARAAVRLVEHVPQRGWRFTFVGRDTMCTAHGRMVSSCLAEIIPGDLRKYFEFIPPIPRSSLPEMARTVVAAVVPSRSESFCLAAHELRALGLPLVVPARPPFLEYFRPETGCLNFDGSVASLAEQLLRLSDDPALRRRLAETSTPQYPPFALPYLELLRAKLAP